MNTLLKKTIAALATSSLMAGLYAVDVPLASARGSAGSIGEAAFAGQAGCLSHASGFLTNLCGSRITVTLPAIYDNAGGLNFQISVRGRVTCSAQSRDPWGGGLRSGGLVSNTDPAGGIAFLHTGVSAHGWGSAYVECDLDSGATVHNFHY